MEWGREARQNPTAQPGLRANDPHVFVEAVVSTVGCEAVAGQDILSPLLCLLEKCHLLPVAVRNLRIMSVSAPTGRGRHRLFTCSVPLSAR